MNLTQDYRYRFSGVERLLGEAKQERLASSHVLVVGLGGVGSWVVEALARSGVGSLTLVDFDDVCISNTNRQLHTTIDSVGQQKTQVMQERAQGINPDIQVSLIDESFSLETEDLIFARKYDLVIDAIDHHYTKYHLILACKKRGLPIVISGSAGGRLDPSLVRRSDLAKSMEDSMLSQLRKKLRQRAGYPRKGKMDLPCVFSMEKPKFFVDGCVTEEKPEAFSQPLDCATGFGTMTMVTGSFGFFMAAEAIKILTSD